MTTAKLPPDHPQRQRLAEEVHARPPAPVQAPAAVSCLALTDSRPQAGLFALRALADRHGLELPPTDAAHVILELPAVRIKWERHGEFGSFTFVRPLAEMSLETLASTGDFPSALHALPPEWLAELPGTTIAAADILLLPFNRDAPDPDQLGRLLDRDALAGARVQDGAAWVFTDFLPRPTGRTRWLILDARMGRAQSARVVQRAIDIEVYRMVALLAYPPARGAFAELARIEQTLERITAATADLHSAAASPETQREEQRLLDELSRAAAEVEQLAATSGFRFAAGQAYWDLVRARVAEFREQRLGDLRTRGGFLARRWAPARDTCAAPARRLERVSARIERAGSLLRTRVDVAREEQNQRMLAAMERRGKLQLRLQQTVEGLSVAAIAYYAVGLLGYLVKPLQAIWPVLKPEWVMAAAVPLVVIVLWRMLKRVRRRMEAD
ncbi:MAG: DUF3422 family protein [Betaproteobacteria bacterium]